MPAATSPFFGINYGWTTGEGSWGDPVNSNFKVLSFLGKGAVDAFVATLPVSPSEGDSVVLTTDKQFYVRLAGVWLFIQPQEGQEVNEVSTGKRWKFSAGSWVEIASSESLIARVGVLEQFDVDLGDASDPSKGSGVVGHERRTPTLAISDSVDFFLATNKVSIWEYEKFITIKPNPTDPSTWSWDQAFAAIPANTGVIEIFRGDYGFGATMALKAGNTYVGDRARFITTLSGVSLPTTVFEIQGSDITFTGIKLGLSIGQIDSSTRGRGISFAASASTYSNIEISGNDFGTTYYAVYGDDITIDNLKITGNTSNALRTDILLSKVKGRDCSIDDNKFPVERNWSTPVASLGEIVFCGNMPTTEQLSAAGFPAGGVTDAMYNAPFENLSVKSNKWKASNHRPIFITNCIDVSVDENQIDGNPGVKATLGCSDDVIILEFCRDFSVSNNKVGASGENGIDMLSCKGGTISGNSCRRLNTVGMMFDQADKATVGSCATMTQTLLVNENIQHSGNNFEAGESCYLVRIGQNIHGTGSGQPYTPSANSKLALAFSPLQTLISTTSMKISNITLDINVTHDRTKRVSLGGLPNTTVNYDWGTIRLGKNCAVESDWIPITALVTTAWVHSLGAYPTVEIYFQIVDPTVYGSTVANSLLMQKIEGMYYDGTKNRGIRKTWQDVNQVLFYSGDYLVDVPQRGSGPGSNMGLITTGNVKLKTY